MGNEKALSSGVGSISDVSALVRNIPDGDEGVKELLSELECALSLFPPGHQYRESASAIICAWLNQRFPDHGWLYSVDGHWDIDRQAITNTQVRELFANSVGIA